MTRARKATLAAVAVLALVAAPAAGADDGPPACSVVAGRPWGVAHPPSRAAELWVQCNFHLDKLEFTTTAPVRRVGAEPQLIGAASGDTLACKRGGTRRGVCTGSVTANARVRVPLTLQRRTCDPKHPFRVRITAEGGPECTTTCSAIGYTTSGASDIPLGC